MAEVQRDAEIIPFPTAPERSNDAAETRKVRDAIGEVLRDERTEQERTLADVAETAAVSVQYLSEIERGRKEVSSDLLSAVCDSLEVEVAEVLEPIAQHAGQNVLAVYGGASRHGQIDELAKGIDRVSTEGATTPSSDKWGNRAPADRKTWR